MRITVQQLRSIIVEELERELAEGHPDLSPDDVTAMAAMGRGESPDTAVARRGVALADTVLRGLPGMDRRTAAAFLGAFQNKFRKLHNLI